MTLRKYIAKDINEAHWLIFLLYSLFHLRRAVGIKTDATSGHNSGRPVRVVTEDWHRHGNDGLCLSRGRCRRGGHVRQSPADVTDAR